MPDENVLTKVATLQHPALWAAGACCYGIAVDRYFDLPVGLYTIIILSRGRHFSLFATHQILSSDTLDRDPVYHQRPERVLASRLLELLSRQ